MKRRPPRPVDRVGHVEVTAVVERVQVAAQSSGQHRIGLDEGSEGVGLGELVPERLLRVAIAILGHEVVSSSGLNEIGSSTQMFGSTGFLRKSLRLARAFIVSANAARAPARGSISVP